MNPGMTQDEALQRAIAELTGCTVVQAQPNKLAQPKQKPTRSEGTRRKAPERPPEHVLRNIQRIKQAEVLRKQTGGVLPTATFVSGGKVSPK